MMKGSSRYPYMPPPWFPEKRDALVAALDALFDEFPISGGKHTREKQHRARRIALDCAERGNPVGVVYNIDQGSGVPTDRVKVIIALLE